MRALPYVVLPTLLFYAVQVVVQGDVSGRADAKALVLAGAFILFIPFQSAAEEILFRGLLPQWFAAWKAPAWLAYGLATILFVLGHAYNWVGLIDILIFGLCASLLAHKLGGLEVPILIHVANNVTFFVLGACGLFDLNSETVSWSATLLSSALTTVITVLVLNDRKLVDIASAHR